MDKNLIGVFDSGVGGLSVLKRLIKKGGNYIYFGDTKNLPYGNKTKEEIIFFTRNIIKFFIEKGAKSVVMACNTSSALAYDSLNEEFKNKIKIYPLIQTVAPIIAKKGKRIGIMATEATFKSKTYTKELKKYSPEIEVLEIPCPKFVPIVENRLYHQEESIENIKEITEEFVKFKADKIVLGCTHYPYLIPIIKNYIMEEKLIDPASYIEDMFEIKNSSSAEFYVSDNPQKFIENAKLFMEIKEEVKQVSL